MFGVFLCVQSICVGSAFAVYGFSYRYLCGCLLHCCLVTSKHRQLLASEMGVHSNNEKGNINFQGKPSGKYVSVRTSVLMNFSLGLLHVFV